MRFSALGGEGDDRAGADVRGASRAAVLGQIAVAVTVGVGLDVGDHRHADAHFDFVEVPRFTRCPRSFDDAADVAAFVVAEQGLDRAAEADVGVFGDRDPGREFVRALVQGLDRAFADQLVFFFADLAEGDQLLGDRRQPGPDLDLPAGDNPRPFWRYQRR